MAVEVMHVRRVRMAVNVRFVLVCVDVRFARRDFDAKFNAKLVEDSYTMALNMINAVITKQAATPADLDLRAAVLDGLLPSGHLDEAGAAHLNFKK